MRLVFDTEGNGLLDTITKMWCMVAKDIETGHIYTGISTDYIIQILDQADELIGHNIIEYDIPVLEKIIGWTPREDVKITDTLVMSRVLNPDRLTPIGIKGGHSLDAWGKRLGRYKPKHEDWSKFSEEMLHRCTEDVEINHLVYLELINEMGDHDWSEALELEHKVAKIIAAQARAGVYFDKDAARSLLDELDKRISDIDEELLPSLPKTVKQNGVTVHKPFKINGEYSKMVCDWFAPLLPPVSGVFSRVEFIEFNLNSDKQTKDYLLEHGWTPTEWNYVKDKTQKTGYRRTSPKLTEDSFSSIEGDMPAKLKERLILKHRRSSLKSLKNDSKGWLNNIREDGTIPASANPCGTNTGRMTHSTVVNVPSSDAEYGKEMRSLFRARPGRVFVGHDAKGLELRMLAHYINDWLYTQKILNGDIHTFNQELARLPTRNDAKTFIYAFIYGAGDNKLGSIIGGGTGDGRAIRNRFLDANPTLRSLITSIKRKSGNGYLNGLDNRKVWMRRGDDGRILRHKALNTLLQSSGAIVMKKSIVLLDQWIREEKLDSIKVIDMHDEGQYDVHPDHVERHMELAAQSIVKAGEHFKLNIPLEADVMRGKNWYHTH